MSHDPRPAARLGPFVLAEGVTPRNAATLMFASFCTIGSVTFLGFMTPYLFEVLQVPAGRQGSLSGLLVSLQEAVQIVIGALVGAWSDRIGRRPLFAGGLAMMAAGFAAYPLAGSEAVLVALRAFYAVGATAATVMLSTTVAEYIDERMRGRWMGTIGVCNGLGVVVMATVFSRLPLRFGALGLDDAAALRASFWVFAAGLLLLALLVHRRLRAPVPGDSGRASLLRQTARGLVVARESPRIALGYATAFASRGDLVIITTFISLWVVQAGTAAGLSLGQATARAGMVFGIAQGVALLWALAMGFILDRVPRLGGVSLAFGLGTLGYTMLGMVDDPLGRGMILAAIAAGIGEASAVVSAGVLIGQEAPAPARGVVIGTFGLCGSVGMICLTFLGGQVFDGVGPHAPFVMMGIVNGAVMLAALAVWRLVPAPAPVAGAASAR
jgi:MFS family permease